jgi:hypothetical protein
MTRSAVLAALLVTLVAGGARAQTAAPSPTPDYSKPGLRFVFSDYLEPPPPPPSDRAQPITVFDRWGWVFKYVPIFTGQVNDGAFGRANPMTMPDPFFATNTQFPETASTYRRPPPNRELSVDERAYRRSMLRVTVQANEADRKR